MRNVTRPAGRPGGVRADAMLARRWRTLAERTATELAALDAARRLAVITGLLAQFGEHELTLTRLRDEAVRTLRNAGHSYATIGELAGISRARVGQLLSRSAESEDAAGTRAILGAPGSPDGSGISAARSTPRG